MTQAEQRISRWRKDPVQFVVDNFNPEVIDQWQKETLQAAGGDFNPSRMLAMKACAGPGKSTVLAWLGWHRLSCFAETGEHPKGAAISGEGRDNLRDNLWAELSKWQQRSEFLTRAFTWNAERISANDHKEDWFLSARSYPKHADTEAMGRSLSGLHSRFPFILLDEIGDMPVELGQKAKQIFSGNPKDAIIAAAGNPTSTTGLLYAISQLERGLWTVITITADPDDPNRTSRVSISHAQEQINQYGRDNPWVMATILGLFPPHGFNALLSVDEVEKAMRRTYTKDQFEFSQKRLGVDVARFGDDRTIIFPRQGLVAFKPAEMRNARTNDIGARVMEGKRKWGSEIEFIDDTGGYGAGVIDNLITAGQSPQGVNSSGKAINPRYANKRAEMWYEMAEWVKRGGKLPNLPKLVRELTVPTYTFVNGKIMIEPKEKIKERLKFSPDMADALSLTFAIPDMPSAQSREGIIMQSEKMKSDWNPFS